MLNWLNKKLTKNYNVVPLLRIDFNLNKYREFGAKNSCIVKLHPELKEDDYIINTLNEIVEHIRENYDMEKVSKI